MPLSHRRILVTGASSGIGEGIARACAGAGAQVAVLARREERLRALAEELGVTPVVADVTDSDALRTAVERAATALGGLDGLVNNAGVMRGDLLMASDEADWRAMFAVNDIALLVATQAAVPHLRGAGGGDVVNVSSMSGRRVPRAGEGTYCGSKFAVHAMSEGLRRELHGDGIRVTVIAPGMVATEGNAPTGGTGLLEELRDPDSDRSIRPAHVARAVVYALGEPPEVTIREIALAPTAQET